MVTLEGQMFESAFLVHSIYPTYFEGFSLNMVQMFKPLRQCAKCRSPTFWIKVIVTLCELVVKLGDLNLSFGQCKELEHKSFPVPTFVYPAPKLSTKQF